MASGNDDYQSTLNKMADLQDLAATVEQASKNLTANKQKLQENIENTIFPHPTLSEAIHESVLKASDKEIHT